MERSMEALKERLTETAVRGVKTSLAAAAKAAEVAAEYYADMVEAMNAENKTDDAE